MDSKDTAPVTQADWDAEAAFDRHIVETIGWTKFASMQTAASGAEYGRAFKAGYLARHNQSHLHDERKAVLQNKRVNDAIQTAIERGELHVTGNGYLSAIVEQQP